MGEEMIRCTLSGFNTHVFKKLGKFWSRRSYHARFGFIWRNAVGVIILRKEGQAHHNERKGWVQLMMDSLMAQKERGTLGILKSFLVALSLETE
jgi:hypothetical protein